MSITTLKTFAIKKKKHTQKRANRQSGQAKGAIKKAKALIRYSDVRTIEWYRKQVYELSYQDNGIVRRKKEKTKEKEWGENSIKEE